MTRDRNGGRFDRRQRLLSATLVAWAAAGALASAAHADLPSGAALVQGGLDRAGKAVAIERLEEFAFALPEGAALDPRLPVREFEVVLQSELALASAGNWQFEVEFEGGEATLELVVDGRSAGVTSTRPVVGATGSLVAPLVLRQPAKVELRLAFRRRGSERARVRTFWSLAGAGRASFVREPLPARALQWPAAQASAAAALAQRRAGQVALVELGCVACHDPGRAATALPERARIDLTGISARAAAPWLRRWIASPQRAQPGGGMPELLAAAPAAAASEVDALLAWLSESERAPAGAATATASAALAPAGQALYDSLGCIACHGVLSGDPAAAAAPVPSAPFGDLAGKWQLEPLAAFLRDPLATRPHGRMPAFALGETESLALAAHLLERFGDAAAATAAKPETAPPDAALVARGRARFEELGCAACHVVAGFEPARAAP
ncbi:MAG: cytochrome c, partial [Planctomycetes bacterium]|nr:cytochrome c [Planctomycetota bacterium]